MFKVHLRGLVIAVAVCVIALTGCSKTPVRTDAMIASEVHNKISNDSRIATREIAVQTDQGVVTLTGPVENEIERASAASDAAAVDGVRTVVNNLVVQAAQAAPSPAEQPAANGSAAPSNAKPASSRPRPATNSRARSQDNLQPANMKDAGTTPPNAQPAPVPEPVVAQAPVAPPVPKKIAIPAGTQLTIRLNDPLDSERNLVGDSFHGTLAVPIVIDAQTVIPSGANVVGHVVDVKSAGRFAGNSSLTLELSAVSVGGSTYNIQTSQWSRQGKGEGKNTAIKAGGGAAIGAIIGGIAGGGKGAAIGTAAGAGAGTGAAATKKGEQIKLGAESTLSFLLINPVTVTPQGSNNLNAGRTPLQ